MPRTYLLIEDDNEIANIVQMGLASVGLKGDWEADGLNGLQRLNANKYGLVISDIKLPGLSGLEVVKRVKEVDPSLPTILLSAKSSCEERVQGLQTGVDDYICKPFSIGELQIRVQKVFNSRDRLRNAMTVKFGDLTLDRVKRTVFRGDQRYDIQEREFLLLDMLLSHPGSIVSKNQILKEICGYSFVPSTNVVDVLICRLREKVFPSDSLVKIRTVRGLGYTVHLSENH